MLCSILTKFNFKRLQLAMKLSLFIGCVVLFLQDAPLKPKEEFDLKLQYEFKQRDQVNTNSVKFDETVAEAERRTSTALLPYVGINLKLLKLAAEEVRVKITDNAGKNIINKKIKQDDVISFNMGFTDDMKDRVTAHEYTVRFLDDDRKELSRILISVMEDGSFFVNSEKRGKF
jgi:hypothetical protein